MNKNNVYALILCASQRSHDGVLSNSFVREKRVKRLEQ